MGRTKPHIYEIGDIVGGGTLRIVKQIRMGKNNIKYYIVQSLAYPNKKNNYTMSEGNIKRGHKCSYISGQRICEENSLWSHKEIRINIINKKQAKTISPNYGKKILFRCANANCTTTKKITPHQLGQKRWYCLSCSGSRSFGETAFNKYQNYNNLGFEAEKILPELPDRRVDFINWETGLWIEIQGKQHTIHGTRGYESAQEQDNAKREFAKSNNQYKLIEIDMRVSSWDYFKEQINNCKYLPSINDKDEKEILKMMESNIDYDITLIKSMYLNDMVSVYVIAEELGLPRRTVENILVRNGVGLRGATTRKVRCINNNKEFDSISDAKKWAFKGSKIWDVCNNNREYAGKHPVTGEKLRWEYV